MERFRGILRTGFAGYSAALLLSCNLSAVAEIRLPKVISDHAVLQRERPLHLWGWASPGARLNVDLHNQSLAVAADDLGRWSVWLKPEVAGGPYTLTVRGDSNEGSLIVLDLLIGDVWVASGQSNMQMPLQGFGSQAVVKDGAIEISRSQLANVRLLHVPQVSSVLPESDQKATWTECSPQNAAKFSAVAYFFGREIAEKEHVAIGLIDSTWGGTPAEAWTSLDGLSSDSSLIAVFNTRAELMDQQARVDLLLASEAREDASARAKGLPVPTHPWRPTPESGAPAGLFNGMIAPLTGLSIRGVIWYQGESNASAGRAPLYSRLFETLISDWRTKWSEGDFPFLFVQLANFESGSEGAWGMVRDAQRRVLKLSNMAMAVSLDVGDPHNIHPADKQTVAHRLALGALSVAYGKNGEYSGPLFRQATTEGSSMRVWFDHAESGLEDRKQCGTGSFEVAGEDHHFFAGNAHLDGSTVVVSSDKVTSPIFVRYGWADAPAGVVYNKAGLPAGTFTSEE